MAQFQKKGAVAKRADTVGTRMHSAVDATSGRWYLRRARGLFSGFANCKGFEAEGLLGFWV